MRHPKIWIVGILSIAAVTSAQLPTNAQSTQDPACVNDAANIQEQRTGVVITGNRNNTDVANTQTNVNQGSRPCGSTGNVQKQRTEADIQGNDNDVRLRSRQTNVDQSDAGNPGGRRRANVGD